ncbi:hypothetical protein, partial [Sulfurospirillum cavolei]|uniref:hypothetical protein n=1 Tax=Sulfurospirillum cavolei TaxID=366522 RepID=UPI003FA2A8AB
GPHGRRGRPGGEAAPPGGEAAQPVGEAAQPVGEAAQPVGFLWASLSPDGERIVAAADDHRLMLWAKDGGGEVAPPGHTGVVWVDVRH